MRNRIKSLAIAGALAFSLAAISHPAMAGKGHGHDRGISLRHLDADGDQAISQEELLVTNQKRFEMLDTDSDGMISPEEFNARLTTMFARLDANEDGVIAGEELPTRKGRKHRRGWGSWFKGDDES